MSATGQYFTDKKGGKTAVELPVESYEKLQNALTDLTVIAERREKKTIPHTEFKRSLKEESTKLDASVIATMSVAPSLAPVAD